MSLCVQKLMFGDPNRNGWRIKPARDKRRSGSLLLFGAPGNRSDVCVIARVWRKIGGTEKKTYGGSAIPAQPRRLSLLFLDVRCRPAKTVPFIKLMCFHNLTKQPTSRLTLPVKYTDTFTCTMPDHRPSKFSFLAPARHGISGETLGYDLARWRANPICSCPHPANARVNPPGALAWPPLAPCATLSVDF